MFRLNLELLPAITTKAYLAFRWEVLPVNTYRQSTCENLLNVSQLDLITEQRKTLLVVYVSDFTSYQSIKAIPRV